MPGCSRTREPIIGKLGVMMKTATVDFLNHGILPFRGREAEVQRLTSFWRNTLAVARLRVALMSGDAGIGKSRLIDALSGVVVEDHGALVRVHLYADTAAAVVPLIARAVEAAGLDLETRAADATLAGVASALRSTARIRPVLLAVDDASVLPVETLRELTTLAGLLADEPISMVCVGRTGDQSLESAVARYVVEDLVVGGLTRDGIADICVELFDDGLAATAIDILSDVTAGSPLALRAALRGAITAKAIVRRSDSGSWFRSVDDRTFHAILQRPVGILLDGMAGHLEPAEREAAAVLAQLGEVFDPGTAADLLDGGEQVVERLAFRGLLASARAFGAPIFGEPSGAIPLTFTHSLVHRQLLNAAPVRADRLVRVIAAGRPIYSAVAFDRVVAGDAGFLDTEAMFSAVDRTLAAARRLEASPDWRLAPMLCTAAGALLDRADGGLDPHRMRLVRCALIDTRLRILQRDIAAEEHALLVDELFALTADTDDEAIAEWRITALLHGLWRRSQGAADSVAATLDEAEAILERFESLRRSEAHVGLLGAAASIAAAVGDHQSGRRVERALDAVCEGAEDSFRDRAFRAVVPNLCWLLGTEQEVERRLAALEALVASDPDDVNTRMWRIVTLDQVGHVDEAARLASQSRAVFTLHGVDHFAFMCPIVIAFAEAAMSGWDDFMDECARIVESAPESIRTRLQRNACVRAANLGVLSGDAELCRTGIAGFVPGSYPWQLVEAWLLLQDSTTVDDAVEFVSKSSDGLPEPLRALCRVGDGAETSAVLRDVHDLLLEAPLRINDLIVKRFELDLCEALANRPGAEEVIRQLHQEIATSIDHCLQMMTANGMYALARALLDRHGERLGDRRFEFWCGHLVGGAASGREPAEVVQIHVMGAVRVRREDGRWIALRTGRVRTLLAVLVADCVTCDHLSLDQLRMIVVGERRSDERMRKGTNLAIHRLRELLGSDAVETVDGLPRLACDRVRVDLIDACEHLAAAERAVRDDIPIRAVIELERVFDAVGGRSPFSDHFQPYFEAVREELEGRVRSATLAVASMLAIAGDAEVASRLLELTLRAYPGDGELCERLHDLLRRQGRFVGAERIRMAERMDEGV